MVILEVDAKVETSYVLIDMIPLEWTLIMMSIYLLFFCTTTEKKKKIITNNYFISENKMTIITKV